MGMVAVPSREEQMATVATLLPFDREAEFQVVELSSGQGLLAYTLLDCFPNARLLALDLSVVMLAKASELLVPFLNRCELEEFDLMSADWLGRIDGADSVVSSLTIHHLSGEGKQQLFQNVFERLAPGGAFIIADLVHPQRPEANELFAGAWDYAAAEQSFIEAGTEEPYELFLNQEWNHYRFPDNTDTPSPLFDQLQWLSAAGFVGVDCFWMRAGHAVYGGYKPGGSPPGSPVGFNAALDAADNAINASIDLDLGSDRLERE
jgi:tRNA (cmo5U34)-methyltransferase